MWGMFENNNPFLKKGGTKGEMVYRNLLNLISVSGKGRRRIRNKSSIG
jgi:hypothetical protein